MERGVLRQCSLEIRQHAFDVLHHIDVLITPDAKSLPPEPVLPLPISGNFRCCRMRRAIDLDDYAPGKAHEVADVTFRGHLTAKAETLAAMTAKLCPQKLFSGGQRAAKMSGSATLLAVDGPMRHAGDPER